MVYIIFLFSLPLSTPQTFLVYLNRTKTPFMLTFSQSFPTFVKSCKKEGLVLAKCTPVLLGKSPPQGALTDPNIEL